MDQKAGLCLCKLVSLTLNSVEMPESWILMNFLREKEKALSAVHYYYYSSWKISQKMNFPDGKVHSWDLGDRHLFLHNTTGFLGDLRKTLLWIMLYELFKNLIISTFYTSDSSFQYSKISLSAPKVSASLHWFITKFWLSAFEWHLRWIAMVTEDAVKIPLSGKNP